MLHIAAGVLLHLIMFISHVCECVCLCARATICCLKVVNEHEESGNPLDNYDLDE